MDSGRILPPENSRMGVERGRIDMYVERLRLAEELNSHDRPRRRTAFPSHLHR